MSVPHAGEMTFYQQQRVCIPCKLSSSLGLTNPTCYRSNPQLHYLVSISMDVTLLPPTTILPHHSHQIYHPLLPSALPRRRSPHHYACPAPRSPFIGTSSYRNKSRHEPPPPIDGSCLLNQLPDEILLSILSYLEWDELLVLRTVERRLSELALSPALHHSLTLLTLPPSPLPSVLAKHILPAARHLHLHLFPYPSTSYYNHPTSIFLSLLQAIPPDQLLTLNLPFSAPYLPMSEMGEISRLGGRLERLDLRGSGLVGERWIEGLKNVGAAGGGLRELDLGFTGITSLPLENPSTGSTVALHGNLPPAPTLHPFRSLIVLSLASCSSLPLSVLSTFLATLPPTVERIDVSRLDQITFQALGDMRATTLVEERSDGAMRPTALKEIKVVGIDHLTRLDVRRLKRHWEDQRRACFPKPIATPLPVPSRKVWGVPRTPETRPETRTITLSPPESPVAPGRMSRSPGERHPFYPTLQSRTTVHDHGLPTPPSSQRSSPVHHDRSGRPRTDMISINIVHSAILESEDEAGYRQFIGEVVGGTLGVGLGLGWDAVPVPVQGESWVEVDGGGVM